MSNQEAGAPIDAMARPRRLARIFSRDHTVIAKQFFAMSIFFLFAGGLLALFVRWQLGFPGSAVPVPFNFLMTRAMAPGGVIAPDAFNGMFTLHATFMVYFAVLPMLVGALPNFLLPLQIGSPRMAFPTLGMLSFWLSLLGGLLMIATYFVDGGPASTGWTAYAPLAAVSHYTGSSIGQNLWILSLAILGVGLIHGAVNHVVTIINHRAPGLTMFRLPLTVWSFLVTGLLVLLALPVITAAVSMLLMDRTLGTSFFVPAGLSVSGSPLAGYNGGGQPLLWQHLFWFFGHPVVYIMILPGMGVVSDILAVFARKPLFGYRAMIYSTFAIAGLGWLVWGHHMFQSGMNPLLGTTFMASTMAIAIPSGVKVFGWLATLWRGQIRFGLPMLFALAFLLTFTVGGLSGIFMASTPVDAFIHDTYFIVGHIHYVLFGGSLFAIFAAIAYWFPKVTGRMLGERLGRLHFWMTFVAFNCTFFPMHILGIGGHMRRIYDPTVYAFLRDLQPVNTFITISAITLGFAQLLLVANIFLSLKNGRRAEPNPWRAATLEWTLPSPPGDGAFAVVPEVHRWPYDYSLPNAVEDYLPQTSLHVNGTGTGADS
ncbi:MAG TPA: cbb3-type cytochrome c oxidase subunit I [Candidatus Kapabacteria bacterium]|nr:cbb3-type cytochrome c oxidase subunit I [Candidatus Kapabacteria bacterium]